MEAVTQNQEQEHQATKNRRVFNDVQTIAGMPSGIFLIGLVICVGLFAATRSFLSALFFAPVYYIPMYAIHKDDVRGLKIWIAVLGQRVCYWESGARKPIALIIKDKRS